MRDLYLALLHHPVLDKNGSVVTTALTNLDLHDIARSARTYDVRRFFVVTQVQALRRLAERILDHWSTGFGSTYNPNRKEALSRVAVELDLDATVLAIERESGQCPLLVMTSARQASGTCRFADLRRDLETEGRPMLIVLGTGWGLTDGILSRADVRLEPILGCGSYNHLSVRAAAAIVLDRLRGTR